MRFDEVFADYTEIYDKGKVHFEGVLFKRFINTPDYNLKRFIAGGARIKPIIFEKDGLYVRCVLRYSDVKRFVIPPEELKADREMLNKIIKMVEKGETAMRIAAEFNISQQTVYDLKAKRGAFRDE